MEEENSYQKKGLFILFLYKNLKNVMI